MTPQIPVIASGPDAALRIVGDGAAIGLLIVDFAMPESNGLEIIRHARLQRLGLKALLITGHDGAVRDPRGMSPRVRRL